MGIVTKVGPIPTSENKYSKIQIATIKYVQKTYKLNERYGHNYLQDLINYDRRTVKIFEPICGEAWLRRFHDKSVKAMKVSMKVRSVMKTTKATPVKMKKK